MTITYEYDNIGNVKRILKDGTTIYSCELDADMQLIKECDYASNTATQYFYTATGSLYLSRKTCGENVILSYTITDDETGKTDYVTEINGVKLTYSSVYDEENDISKYILPNLEEITSDTDDLDRTTAVYLKDSEGNTLLSCTYGYVDKTVDGQVKTSEYISSMTYSNGDRYEYTYDANGNITRYREGSVVMEYHYDELGQLIREDNGHAQKSWTYTYDTAGNILTKTEYPYSTGNLYYPGRTDTYTYSTGNWGDQLTSYNNETFEYDALGNPVVWRDSEATWDGRNLASYWGFDFTYNADGVRTRKESWVYSADYILDENNGIVGEIWDSGDYLYYYYDESGSPVSFSYNGDIYYYVKNQQGDVIKIIDEDGDFVSGYRYDAWGRVMSTYGDDSVGTVNPFLYRGYYYDWDLELYYLQSRYYDPVVGRFLNADDTDYLGASGTVLGYNLYAYCENDAVNFNDFNGCWKVPTWVLGTTLDVLFTIMNAAMSAGFISLGVSIKILARSPWTRKAAENLITKKVIPTFIFGFMNPLMTIIRKAAWRIAGVTIEYGKSWFSDKIGKALEKQKLISAIYNSITSVSSWGSIIAMVLDYADGKKDDHVTLY